MSNTVSLSIFTFMLAVGQMLFKRVGLSVHGLPPADAFLTVIRQPLLYAALALYGFATLLWIWILARVPLSQAYPWVALGTLIVPVMGWCVFGERPAPIFWLGVFVVIAGVILTQYGSQSS